MIAVAACPVCDGYEFVDGPNGMLAPCPECGRETVTCPVHGEHVMTRGGVLVGTCWRCATETAAGLAWLKANPA